MFCFPLTHGQDIRINCFNYLWEEAKGAPEFVVSLKRQPLPPSAANNFIRGIALSKPPNPEERDAQLLAGHIAKYGGEVRKEDWNMGTHFTVETDRKLAPNDDVRLQPPPLQLPGS